MSFHQQPNTYVNSVHLKIRNIDRSVQFYTEILGLKVITKSEKVVSLSADGQNPLVVIEEIENGLIPSSQRTGLYHFALLLPSRPDLANTLYHLLETRYPLQGASDHLVSEAIYLADPDGNGIEIYADRPESSWKKTDDTIEMATNPLDAEDLLNTRKNEPFNGLPTETIMGHIHLQVSTIEESEQFYGALGFNPVNRYGRQALFVSTGGYHHHIGLNTWNSSGAIAPTENEVGIKHFTIKFTSKEAFDTAINKLHAMNVHLTQTNGQYSILDPSHNVVLLTIY